MKENLTIRVDYDNVLSPAIETQIKSQVKEKYGEKTKVIVTGLKKNNIFEKKMSSISINDFRQIYKDFFDENNIEISFDDFMELDGEISAHLSTKNDSHKIKLKTLKSKNLLSFNEVEIDFQQTGIIRIFSEPQNTGGKSNLTKIIKIFLFGEYYKSGGERATQDSYLNKFSPLNFAYVEGEIEIDGENYFIRRDFTKSKNSKVSHKLTVTNETGKIVDNSYFEQLTGDIKNFLFISYFDTFSVEKWLRTKPTERYRLFVNYFGLQNLEAKYSICKKMYDEWFKQSKTKQFQHFNIPQEIKQLTAQIENLEREISAAQDNLEHNESVKNKLLSDQNRIKNLMKGVPDSLLGENKQKIFEEIENLSFKIQCIQQNIDRVEFIEIDIDESTLQQEITKKRGEFSTVKETKKQADDMSLLNYMLKTYKTSFTLKEKHDLCQSEISNFRNQYLECNTLKKTKESILNELLDFTTCLKCGETTDNIAKKRKLQLEINELAVQLDQITEKGKLQKNHLETINQQIADEKFQYEKDILGKIEILQKEIENTKTSKIAEINKEISKLEYKLNDHLLNKETKRLLKGWETEITLLKTRENELQEKLKYVNQFENSIKENEQLKEKIEDIQKDINYYSNLIENFAVQIKVNEIQKNKCIEEISKYNQILSELKDEIDRDKLFNEYLSIHSKSGVSMQILKDFVQEVNDGFKYFLNDDDFLPSIKIENESIDFEFSRDEFIFDLSEGSGYEKTITSLCLHFLSLQKMETNFTNLFIMDEVFSAFSKSNLEKIKNVLDKMLSVFDTIFLITHHEEVASWADHDIKIVKKNNISKII